MSRAERPRPHPRAPARATKPAAKPRAVPVGAPEPVYFPSAAAFGRWLAAHHARATHVWCGFHKVGTGTPSLTWPESVDEALCVGWIDGIRKGVDAGRYTIRFTPRKPGSHWSAVNVRRFEALAAAGRVTPAGRAAFAARREDRTARASYEQRSVDLPPAYAKVMRAHRAAWAFFQATAPSYRKACVWWIVSAKQETTRQRRLASLVEHSAAGRGIPQFLGPVKARAQAARARSRPPGGKS